MEIEEDEKLKWNIVCVFKMIGFPDIQEFIWLISETPAPYFFFPDK